MKNPKKILLACLPVLLIFSMVSLWLSPKAAAYVATTSQEIQNATFEFKNRALVVAKIGNQTVNFVDRNPFDSNIEFVAVDYECTAKINPPDDVFALSNLGNYEGSIARDRIHIEYQDTNGNSGCTRAQVSRAPTNVDDGMRTFFNWVDAGTIETVDGEKVFTKTGNNDYFLYTGEAGEKCQDRVFLVTTTTRAGDNTPTTVTTNSGRYFELSDGNGLSPRNTSARDLPLGDCGIVGFNFGAPGGIEFFNERYSNPFRIGEEQNKVKAAGTGQTSNGAPAASVGGGDDDSSDCVLNSSTTFEWILCPLITTVSKATEGINKLIEDQLNFNVEENLNNDIKRVWGIVRVLVTSLLVIIMLVMVISQAISAGPFDAYTVRKMLPRLVVAAIVVQLSWDLAIWLITLANDAGQGIKQLITIPFGGGGELDLPSILNRLSSTWGGITSISLLAFLIAAPTLAVAFLPGIALVAFTIFLSVLVALATLLFRNVLIIAGVIFLPLAILAWILPGTQKYWALWKDNFTKILLLFPIIIALIYIGRVFAWMAAGLGEPGFLDFVMVLVGFFGPYFIIPKAFSWGGSLMATASRSISDSGPIKKGRETGQRLIGQDFNNYWKGKMAREKYNQYDEVARIKRGKLGIPYLQGRLFGRMASQHWMPTAHGTAQTLREGKSWAEERTSDAEAFDRRAFELAQEHGYAIDEETDKPYFPGLEKDLPMEKRHRPKVVRDDDGNIILNEKTGLPTLLEKPAGVAAAKQALVDLTSLANVGGDMRKAKQGVAQLIDTSSNPEIENATIWHGPDAGKRVYERQEVKPGVLRSPWEEQVGGSTTHYPATAKSNYDLQVHVRQYGFPKFRKNPKDDPIESFLYDYAVNDRGINPQDLGRGVRFDDDDPGRTLYVLGKDAKMEELASQSLGQWQRQRRMQKDAKEKGHTKMSTAIGDALVGQLKKQAALGPSASGVFQALRGEAEGEIDTMLAESAVKITRPDGKTEPITLKHFIQSLTNPEIAARETIDTRNQTIITPVVGRDDEPVSPAGTAASDAASRPDNEPPDDSGGGGVVSRPGTPYRPSGGSSSVNTVPGARSDTAPPPAAGRPTSGGASGSVSTGSGGMTLNRGGGQGYQGQPNVNIDAKQLAEALGESLAPAIESMGASLKSSHEEIGKNISDEIKPHIEEMGDSIGKSVRSSLADLKPGQDVSLRGVVPADKSSSAPQQPIREGSGARQEELVQELRALRRQIREMPAGKRDPESQMMLEKIEREHPEFKQEDEK